MFSTYEEHRAFGASPAEGHGDGKIPGGPPVWRQAENHRIIE